MRTKKQIKQREFHKWRNTGHPLVFSYKIVVRHGKKYVAFAKEVFIPVEEIKKLIREIERNKLNSTKVMGVGLVLAIPIGLHKNRKNTKVKTSNSENAHESL